MTRLLYAGRISLEVGVFSTLIAASIGIVLGLSLIHISCIRTFRASAAGRGIFPLSAATGP